jgi:hypothetical protein
MKTIRLDEGFALLALDYAMAIRIIKYLWQDYSKTEAFKLGIIDEEGKLLKSPSTSAEKMAYSPFIRLVLNLKRMIGKLPGGSSKIGSMIAAYALMRECVESDEEANFLDEILAPVMFDNMNIHQSIGRFISLVEDGVPVNSTAGATSPSTGGYDTPMNTGHKKKKIDTIINRKKPISTIEPSVLKVKPIT